MIERVARMRLWMRAGLAGGLGVVSAGGFAPYGWWPLVLIGVGGFSLIMLGSARVWQAMLLGYAWGLGFMGVGVGWMSAVFADAMLALVGFTALFPALLAVWIHLVRTTRWWPVTTALGWVLVEALAARWPFGGFGWMRLGFAMIDSPLAGLYPLVGTVGVTFAVALVANLLVWVLRSWSVRRGLLAGTAVALLLIGSAGGLALPAGDATQTVSLGWVQGGAPGGGVYGIGAPRTTTVSHHAETVRLAEQVAAGKVSAPEAVIWPENGTDMDPAHDLQTRALVEAAVAAVDRPILVGTILDGPGVHERQTASLWWEPGTGVTDRYLKRGIVPFGEWVPLRDLLEPLIPRLSYVGPQSIPGTEPGVLPVTVASGELKLGTLVCYDVAFDSYAFDTVAAGAQILVVQSSNAMYQGTGQIDQQFAITRVRAAELRREILVVTTSGVSGLITPDGGVVWSVSDPGAHSGVVELPRRSGVTPAAVLAPSIEIVAGLAALLVLLGLARRARRRRLAA